VKKLSDYLTELNSIYSKNGESGKVSKTSQSMNRESHSLLALRLYETKDIGIKFGIQNDRRRSMDKSTALPNRFLVDNKVILTAIKFE